jgi:hypothetical protein
MMVSEFDIYRAAQALVKQHGEDAAKHAAQRHDELLESGDVDWAVVWKKIIRAVEELQRVEPGDGETRH